MMSDTPEQLGYAIAIFGVALAIFASTILWRHQVVRLRRVLAELLVVPESNTQKDTLSALSARTGAIVLHRTLPDAYGRDLLLFQDILYMETYSDSAYRGHICALRASDGASVWQYTVMGPQTYTYSLQGGVLYVPSMGPTLSQIHITALRASDGKQLWQWIGQGTSLQHPPVVTAKALYFMSSSTQLSTIR